MNDELHRHEEQRTAHKFKIGDVVVLKGIYETGTIVDRWTRDPKTGTYSYKVKRASKRTEKWAEQDLIHNDEYGPSRTRNPSPTKTAAADATPRPTSELDTAQEPLTREVLAEYAAAQLWAKLAAEITTAAEQTTPHQRPSRSATLSRVQILRIISEQTHQLAVSQAIKAVRDGATLSTTAAALGVSRQRVHQLIREQ